MEHNVYMCTCVENDNSNIAYARMNESEQCWNGGIMVVETKWFGTIEIGEDKIITFEKGLLGLTDYKKFTLVFDTEKSDAKTIMWLQSLEDKTFALPVMEPSVVMPDYDPIVEDELLTSLGDIQHVDLLVLVTLTVPSDITQMTCNLKAPIIINSDNLNACQLIADNDEYKVKFPIYEVIEKAKKGGE